LNVAQQVSSVIGSLETEWIPAPIAHGWGVSVLHQDKKSTVLVDIGSETTEVAIISDNSIVSVQSIEIGASNISQAIGRYCRRELGIEVGHNQVEALKMELDFDHSHENQDEDKKSKMGKIESIDKLTLVKGRAIQTGLPTSMTVKHSQILPIVEEVALELLASIHQVLTDIPPEMDEEVMNSGVVVVGGGSLSGGLSAIFQQRLGIHIHAEASDTLSAVRGVKNILKSGQNSLFLSIEKK
jgi:rod shape-determining protein MreB